MKETKAEQREGKGNKRGSKGKNDERTNEERKAK
jgi:hypothetical protein